MNSGFRPGLGRRPRAGLGLLCTLLLVTCAHAPLAGPPSVHRYFPLEAGRSWTFCRDVGPVRLVQEVEGVSIAIAELVAAG